MQVSQSNYQLQVPEEVLVGQRSQLVTGSLGLGAVRNAITDAGHAGCSWRLQILHLLLWLWRQHDNNCRRIVHHDLHNM